MKRTHWPTLYAQLRVGWWWILQCCYRHRRSMWFFCLGPSVRCEYRPPKSLKKQKLKQGNNQWEKAQEAGRIWRHVISSVTKAKVSDATRAALLYHFPVSPVSAYPRALSAHDYKLYTKHEEPSKCVHKRSQATENVIHESHTLKLIRKDEEENWICHEEVCVSLATSNQPTKKIFGRVSRGLGLSTNGRKSSIWPFPVQRRFKQKKSQLSTFCLFHFFFLLRVFHFV